MNEIADRIVANVVESLNMQVDKIISYAGTIIVLLVLFVFAYAIGLIASRVLNRGLKLEKMEDFVIKQDIMRSRAWEHTGNFLTLYVKWFVVISLLTLSEISIITEGLYPFMTTLSWFILLFLVGLLVGGVLSKFIRDLSMDFGWEEKLVKYGLADALGDISITNLLTGIVRWYVVLLFIAQGTERFGGMTVLSDFMSGLMDYIPKALLGIVIMVTSLLIADYAGGRIKHRKVSFAETMALCMELVIVFFGVVIALPHFGVTNVSILEDSFKILMAGVSLAFAIAAGLGLKDFVSRTVDRKGE